MAPPPSQALARPGARSRGAAPLCLRRPSVLQRGPSRRFLRQAAVFCLGFGFGGIISLARTSFPTFKVPRVCVAAFAPEASLVVLRWGRVLGAPPGPPGLSAQPATGNLSSLPAEGTVAPAWGSPWSTDRFTFPRAPGGPTCSGCLARAHTRDFRRRVGEAWEHLGTGAPAAWREALEWAPPEA